MIIPFPCTSLVQASVARITSRPTGTRTGGLLLYNLYSGISQMHALLPKLLDCSATHES